MYELKPFLCLAVAAYLFQSQYMQMGGAPFAKVSAIILMFCSIMILYMRGHYRGYFK